MPRLNDIIADGQALGRSGNSPAGLDAVTQAELDAAIEGVSGTYEPLVESFRLYPHQFTITTGSPTLTTLNTRLAVWAFDDAADERVATLFTAPSHWASFDVDFIVANLTADAGDVRHSVSFAEYADGDTLDVLPSTQQGTVHTAPAQYIADVVRVSTSAIAVTPGKQQLIMAGRTGNSGFDTKAGDMAFVAAILTKAS